MASSKRRTAEPRKLSAETSSSFWLLIAAEGNCSGWSG
jgi:hypothetical protein